MTELQKDQMMILLESIESKVQISIEAVGSLNDKIDGVEARLSARIDEVESTLSQAVVSLNEKFVELDEKVVALDEKVDRVEERLSSEIAELKAVLNEHRSSTEMHQPPKKRPLKRV